MVVIIVVVDTMGIGVPLADGPNTLDTATEKVA